MKTDWTYQYTPEIGNTFDWEKITAAYNWVRLLKDTPQDPIYHAEGNVYVHTKMVLDELIQLESWQNLNETDRSILFVAALMHDIAKPRCTETIDGRISSPRHAMVGAKMARSLIFRNKLGEIPFEIREKIVDLVRYHGLPLWFLEKENPEKYVIKVSQHLNLDHLAILAEADVRGRICQDQEDLLDKVDLFRDFLEELNCIDQPFSFENDLAKFIYFYKNDSSPHYIPFDDYEFEVVLLVGLPGSGKNTWIKENKINYEQICLDDIRRSLRISPKGNQGKVIQAAKTLAKTFLRKKQSFIWNATNLQKSRREKLTNLFTTYHANVRIIYIESDYKTLLRRNKMREHPIPFKVLERFIDGLEVPRTYEARTLETEIM
jgi:putative nucleotidyltransferase with HDIG domain